MTLTRSKPPRRGYRALAEARSVLGIHSPSGVPMIAATKIGLVAAALTASTLVAVGPAEAVRDFANCDAMHRVYDHGVAHSRAAAARQVRTGHYRPAVKPRVYRANSESDADNDGTACEVTR